MVEIEEARNLSASWTYLLYNIFSELFGNSFQVISQPE